MCSCQCSTSSTCAVVVPFFCRNNCLRLNARPSCPLLRRAIARASIVGQEWFGGAHFNHWLIITLK